MKIRKLEDFLLSMYFFFFFQKEKAFCLCVSLNQRQHNFFKENREVSPYFLQDTLRSSAWFQGQPCFSDSLPHSQVNWVFTVFLVHLGGGHWHWGSAAGGEGCIVMQNKWGLDTCPPRIQPPLLPLTITKDKSRRHSSSGEAWPASRSSFRTALIQYSAAL